PPVKAFEIATTVATEKTPAACPDGKLLPGKPSNLDSAAAGMRGRSGRIAGRLALRESARSPSLPRSLGTTLGRHAHPRHHQTAGGSHVCGRETHVASAAAGAFPLLPVWRTHRASGRLRRG